MKSTWICLALFVVNTFAQDETKAIMFEPTKDCKCVSPDISMEERLNLVAKDNDFNQDGFVTLDDFAVDLKERYDLNNDGIESPEETVNHYSCAYGVTKYVAQYVYALIRRDSITGKFDFDAGVPIDVFKENNRQRFVSFFENQCVNKDQDQETKIQGIVEDNDFNNDGMVTPQDIKYDFDQFYDTDKDGNLSLTEFLVRWLCRHGDSPAYIMYMFNEVAQGAESIPADFSLAPNMTREEFAQSHRDRYARFAAFQGPSIADFVTLNKLK